MTARIITVRNVNTALQDGLYHLATSGSINDSRNGPVLVAPGPVITEYHRPCERVLFSPLRDANPFFHMYESLWMLAGRNDAASVSKFAKTMESFADEDGVLHGAYGFRWREYFAFDQLTEIVNLLRKDPKTRRAVLTMWAPNGDLIPEGGQGGMTSKDVPCNTTVYFDGTTGRLNMTVCNRSNDIVWGAYGANSVHMSFLQEVIASAVSLPVGVYYQFSNNYHTYVNRPDVDRLIQARPGGMNVLYYPEDRYENPVFTPLPIRQVGFQYDRFIEECEHIAASPYEYGPSDVYLRRVVTPMMNAHYHYKQGDYNAARHYIGTCRSVDWAVAGTEWLNRREAAANAKAAK